MITQFPEIKADAVEDDDLIYLQIGALARYANESIERARFDEVERVFQFFHLAIDKVSSNMRNAFFVSFLEHINMDGDSEKEKYALKLLPTQYLEDYLTLRGI